MTTDRDRTGMRPPPPPRHPLRGGLHIVATPIGNLGDITLRALETLRGAHIVAAEDTRVTGRLLRHFDIATPQTPYHEHNAERARPALIERMKRGEIVALVSDAGMPLVSDPGYRLVRAAVEAGVEVTAVPGPSAALAALAVSAQPTDRFLFGGFLPSRPVQRRRTLEELAGLRATLVFFESPVRLAGSLADMADILGPRPAAVARELTKLHEEVSRDTLPALADHYREAGPPKGEVAVVIAPPAEQPEPAGEALDDMVRRALATMSIRDAAAAVAAATGAPRRKVYARALALSGGDDGDREP